MKLVFKIISEDILQEYKIAIISQKKLENGIYSYFGAGYLKVDRRLNHTGRVELPFNHYHGISICFAMDEAITSLPVKFNGFSVDIRQISI